MPKPMTSNAKAQGRFSKADFIYIARDDEYQCPAGERLRRHQSSVENGMRIDTVRPKGEKFRVERTESGRVQSWERCSFGCR